MKKISVVTPCFNEEANVQEVYERVKQVFKELKRYNYEHIFIDNSSTDKTLDILKSIAKIDKNIKIIVNIKNFGHIRSPYYGLFQAQGDAVILLVSDLQDPPELIKNFIKKWEQGFKIVIGVKNKSQENPLMFLIRKIFYNIIKKFSEIDQVRNFTGFGLYDKRFIDILKKLDEPYPYFRGLIAELGFDMTEIEYTQPKRKRGRTKNNFYTLYDIAMLGIVSYSKMPLRLATFMGFILASLSMIYAFINLIFKLIYWKYFQFSAAAIIIGIFFFSAVQLFFIGVIGEYIGSIFTQVKKRPLVIEKERINFNKKK